jgi:hypothetical protein
MNLSNLILHIHWVAVIVMTVFSFALGSFWHSSFMFGMIWKKETNPNNIKIKINAPLIFGGTAIAHFIAISSISAIVSGLGGLNGLLTGLLISIVWILPAMAGTYLFANRSIRLLAIDTGMYIVLFSICGFILGIW